MIRVRDGSLRAGLHGAILTVLTVACGAPLGPEVRLAEPARLRPADAIVVLGNRPPTGPDGRVAEETGRRVRRGVELYRRGLAPWLVVAGGPAPGGGTEADVMADYAVSLGVPRQAILREARSRDTAENAAFSIDLLCAGPEARSAGEPEAPCAPAIILVSSPYHLRRARELFRCAGASVQTAGTEIPDDVGYQASFTALEYAVRFVYVFDDACARARRSVD